MAKLIQVKQPSIPGGNYVKDLNFGGRTAFVSPKRNKNNIYGTPLLGDYQRNFYCGTSSLDITGNLNLNYLNASGSYIYFFNDVYDRPFEFSQKSIDFGYSDITNWPLELNNCYLTNVNSIDYVTLVIEETIVNRINSLNTGNVIYLVPNSTYSEINIDNIEDIESSNDFYIKNINEENRGDININIGRLVSSEINFFHEGSGSFDNININFKILKESIINFESCNFNNCILNINVENINGTPINFNNCIINDGTIINFIFKNTSTSPFINFESTDDTNLYRKANINIINSNIYTEDNIIIGAPHVNFINNVIKTYPFTENPDQELIINLSSGQTAYFYNTVTNFVASNLSGSFGILNPPTQTQLMD